MIIDRDHPSLIQPEDHEMVWRYMDFDKFESLLQRKALFFCRVDSYSDPFEGSIPKREADFRYSNLRMVTESYGSSFDKKQAEKTISNTSFFHKKFKKYTIANCWHINSNESDAMWRLYLKSNEGIAIKTTVKSLIESLTRTNEQIAISKVRYIDYENACWHHPIEYPCRNYSFYAPIIHKRIEFAHESELRLFMVLDKYWNIENFWNSQESDLGKFIDVDIEILIDEVILPPTSDDIIEEKVKKIMGKYNLSKTVRRSKLSEEPIY